MPAALLLRAHAAWDEPGTGLDDLLVALADEVWKAKRATALEQSVVDRLAAASGQETWEAFLALDEECERLAAGADARLAFQNAYPTRT